MKDIVIPELAHHACMPPPLMVENDAAAWLGLSPRTLRNWRASGQGPAYIKLGSAARYDLQDLRAWVASRRVE